MELEGKVWKDGKFWLVEVPFLDVMTQGKTEKDAFKMIRDAIFELVASYFPAKLLKDFDIKVHSYGNGIIGISTNNNKLLSAFALIRQREVSGLTVREASEKLGSKSPNAYAQYEKGTTNITLDKFEKLLFAVNPNKHSLLRLVG
jgi:predicted RNase H-like HicB family nuclease